MKRFYFFLLFLALTLPAGAQGIFSSYPQTNHLQFTDRFLVAAKTGGATFATRTVEYTNIFNIFNTWTDVNNWERVSMAWAANNFVIQTEKLGTGAARNLILRTPTTVGLYFDSDTVVVRSAAGAGGWAWNNLTGVYYPAADNASDLGAGSPNRLRSGYFGTMVRTPKVEFSTTAYVEGAAAGPEAAKTATVGSGYYRNDGGVNTTFYVKESGAGNTGWVAPLTEVILDIPAFDVEATAITLGTAKRTYRIPYAFTLTGVRAWLKTASTGGIPTFDINKAGVSILGTTLTIDVSEKTSVTAAIAATLVTTAMVMDDEITIDVDVAGTGAAGPVIRLIGKRNGN